MSSKKKNGSSSKDEQPSMDFLTRASGSGVTRRHTPKTSSSDRLPSVRPKRDLTLGGVPKKSFAPTIPTSRRIKKEPEELETKNVKKDGKGRRDRKEGKGRKKGKEVIASASVFSMGPADRGMAGRRGSAPSGGGGGQTSDDIRFAKKPSSLTDNKTSTTGYTHTDEQCDPVQAASIDELFASSKHPPTQLPLDYLLHTTHRVVVPKQVKVIKDEHMDYEDSSGLVGEDSSGLVGEDSSGLVGEDSKDTESLKLAKGMVAPPAQVKGHQVKIADLFTPADPSKGQFLFLQLPDCLPATKSVGGETSDTQSSSKTNGTASTSGGEESDDPSQRHCFLRDLPEGLVGQLKVHKSGRVRLSLGEVSFDVAMGTPCGFLQELASVRMEKPESKLTILGQLSHRLVCTPDFDSLLEQSEHR